MKKAVMVFTKVPKLGEVKTRLTEARGGIFTPEEANDFYESCLLDVIDVCLSIRQADIWICYNKDGERSYLDSLLAKVKIPQRIAGVFSDQGGSFDQCMQYAADFILKSGREDRFADGLLIIGGDLPTLQPGIVEAALAKMESLSMSEAGQKAANKKVANEEVCIGASIVEGACQEGGFSIVGFTCSTPFDFDGVFYNQEGVTALDMLVNKVEEKELPFAAVEMVPDVDIPVDLAGLMPTLRAIEISAKNDPSIIIPVRTISYLREIGLQSVALPPVREAI